MVNKKNRRILVILFLIANIIYATAPLWWYNNPFWKLNMTTAIIIIIKEIQNIRKNKNGREI